jgi:hypothetical protein
MLVSAVGYFSVGKVGGKVGVLPSKNTSTEGFGHVESRLLRQEGLNSNLFKNFINGAKNQNPKKTETSKLFYYS